jgi:hypothetical protein
MTNEMSSDMRKRQQVRSGGKYAKYDVTCELCGRGINEDTMETPNGLYFATDELGFVPCICEKCIPVFDWMKEPEAVAYLLKYGDGTQKPGKKAADWVFVAEPAVEAPAAAAPVEVEDMPAPEKGDTFEYRNAYAAAQAEARAQVAAIEKRRAHMLACERLVHFAREAEQAARDAGFSNTADVMHKEYAFGVTMLAKAMDDLHALGVPMSLMLDTQGLGKAPAAAAPGSGSAGAGREMPAGFGPIRTMKVVEREDGR